jgi:hypothetical protein
MMYSGSTLVYQCFCSLLSKRKLDRPAPRIECTICSLPVWLVKPSAERQQTKLKMVETAMQEPDCVNTWCRSINTVQWGGPAHVDYTVYLFLVFLVLHI